MCEAILRSHIKRVACRDKEDNLAERSIYTQPATPHHPRYHFMFLSEATPTSRRLPVVFRHGSSCNDILEFFLKLTVDTMLMTMRSFREYSVIKIPGAILNIEPEEKREAAHG